MAATNIDYINTSFEYPVLSKIQGQPTYPTLKTIKDKLKANATSVPTDLGRGSNRHLGLVLTLVKYALVDSISYVEPAHPGTLIIPVGTTQHESTRLREEHKEAVQLFREVTNVKKALLKQLGQAVLTVYLKRFRNTQTNTITTPLPVLLEHLFTTYGAIEEEDLREKETSLRAKVFDICEPLDELFNKVVELQELATASRNPYSPKQHHNLEKNNYGLFTIVYNTYVPIYR